MSRPKKGLSKELSRLDLYRQARCVVCNGSGVWEERLKEENAGQDIRIYKEERESRVMYKVSIGQGMHAVPSASLRIARLVRTDHVLAITQIICQ